MEQFLLLCRHVMDQHSILDSNWILMTDTVKIAKVYYTAYIYTVPTDLDTNFVVKNSFIIHSWYAYHQQHTSPINPTPCPYLIVMGKSLPWVT